MNKSTKMIMILICVIFIIVLVFYCYNTISHITSEISLVKESTINFIEKAYPGFEFNITGIKYDKSNYYVDLSVNDDRLSLVRIRCCVRTKIIENGYYYVEVWSTTNIEYLRQGD